MSLSVCVCVCVSTSQGVCGGCGGGVGRLEEGDGQAGGDEGTVP